MRFMLFFLQLITISVLGDKILGVNYGDRFIPEDWLTDIYTNTKYGPTVTPGDSRVSLCDVTDKRIFQYLNEHVREDDFQKMQQFGVKVLRVPTGYWNWIYNANPNCPSSLADRLKNLNNMGPPTAYNQSLINILSWASQYNIKVMLDLHAAPGTQAKDIWTGCYSQDSPVFDTDWNAQLAIAAVEAMAKMCASFQSCYGIEVLNEPQTPQVPLDYLKTYYSGAITVARKYLPKDVPIILFSWTRDLGYWKNVQFPYDTYGNVMWDTHLYHQGSSDPTESLNQYTNDLNMVKDFATSTNASIFVGEFALVNLQVDRDQAHHDVWQKYAQDIFAKILDACDGAILWNWDYIKSNWASWGMLESASNDNMGLDWTKILVN